MRVLFLDLARRTGLAFGDSRMKPMSWFADLGAPGSDVGLQCGELARQLEKCRDDYGPPDLVGIEKWMNPRGQPAQSIIESSLRLNGVVHAVVGGLWGCRIVEPTADTIRKMVCGRARTGDRKKTKRMVIAAVQALGLLPAASVDDDRADAIAGWFFCCSNYASRWPAEFNLR